MRVCLVSNGPTGGFKSFLENVAQLLLKNNCEVSIVFLGNIKVDIPGTDTIYFDLYKHQNGRKRLIQVHSLIEKIVHRLNPKRTLREAKLKHTLFQYQLRSAYAVESCTEVIDLSNYDCVISTEEVLCNYFTAKKVKAKKKIGYIHPDYLMAHFNRKIDTHYLGDLDYICTVSKAGARSLCKGIPSLKEKIVGIPNPLNVEAIIEKSMQEPDILFQKHLLNIVTVCRLDNSSKALDRLLELVKLLKAAGDHFIWRIVGEGSYRAQMDTFIEENQLHDSVILVGFKENPLPLVKQSDLFVLQSYYEGYPMSVCESLIVGTPVLITDYPSAPEQIENGVDGYIVKNHTDSIFHQLHYIINNPEELKVLRKNLNRKDVQRFNTIGELLNIIGED